MHSRPLNRPRGGATAAEMPPRQLPGGVHRADDLALRRRSGRGPVLRLVRRGLEKTRAGILVQEPGRRVRPAGSKAQEGDFAFPTLPPSMRRASQSMPILRQNSRCARFRRSCSRLVSVGEVVALDQHVGRVDRLPRGCRRRRDLPRRHRSSVSLQSRPQDDPQALALAHHFGDTV